MKVAGWMQRLGTETAFEVLARAKQLESQGREIIHLEIGEPDFDTPENIRRRAQRALDEGWTHYGPSAGLPECRSVVAEYVSKSRGITVSPEEVIVTPGGKPIIFFTILSVVNPGDEVIYPNPGFPIYESMASFVGAKLVPWPQREENDFAPDIDELSRLVTQKTRLLILNSPANPTGGMLTRDALERLAGLLSRFPDVWVLSDEIYSEILYEGKHLSIAAFDGMRKRTIILDGFSKTYAMTGWRAGYGVVPEPLTPHIVRLMTNSVSCTSVSTQMACIEALRGPRDGVGKMVEEFRRRRDVIVDGLNKLPGFSCKKPLGAFYVFPNIKGTGMKSKVLEDRLLSEAGVACLSGTSFGQFGEGYLRFSYANSVENIRKALSWMEQTLTGVRL